MGFSLHRDMTDPTILKKAGLIRVNERAPFKFLSI